MAEKPKRKLSWKAWAGIAAAVVVVGSIGNALNGDDEAPAPSPVVAASASAAPSSSPVPNRAKVEPAAATPTAEKKLSNEDWAEKKYQDWLDSRGVKSHTEILAADSTSVQGYLVSAEAPTYGTVVFTAQLTSNEATKLHLENAASSVLNLIGFEDEEVERVEIVTADSQVRGVANRRDSALLNQ